MGQNCCSSARERSPSIAPESMKEKNDMDIVHFEPGPIPASGFNKKRFREMCTNLSNSGVGAKSRDSVFPQICPDATALVGNTPLVFLDRLTKGLPGRIAAKIEYFNPTCSIKDRAGFGMIFEAERKGILTPGKSVIIECTSGNLGVSMAHIAAVRGYKVILIVPGTSSVECRTLMRAYGADVILMDEDSTIKDGIERAYKLAVVIPNSVVLDQFVNAANPASHYETTGKEIWEQTEGKVAAGVFAVGSGGTLSGIGSYLKEQNGQIDIYSVEPEEAAILSGTTVKRKHVIQGIGTGIVPETLDTSLISESLMVSSQTAMEMSRRVAKEEGLMVGISSGANAAAALAIASRPEMEGKLIVTIFADFGERYMSSDLYKEVFTETTDQSASTLDDDVKKYSELYGW